MTFREKCTPFFFLNNGKNLNLTNKRKKNDIILGKNYRNYQHIILTTQDDTQQLMIELWWIEFGVRY